MSPELVGIEWEKVPWFVAITFMIFTAVLAYIEKRQASRDNIHQTILEANAKRQKELDEYTKNHINELQEDINRLRDDLLLEKKRNMSTEDEMKELHKENRELKVIIEDLRKENQELKRELASIRKERKEEKGE